MTRYWKTKKVQVEAWQWFHDLDRLPVDVLAVAGINEWICSLCGLGIRAHGAVVNDAEVILVCPSDWVVREIDGSVSVYRDTEFKQRFFSDADDRHSTEYRKWRMLVFKRDGYACKKCGSKTSLNAHHIKSFKDYPDLRYELNNGITLCAECHKEEHWGCGND